MAGSAALPITELMTCVGVLAARFECPRYGFYLTAAWQGNLAALKADLTEQSWQPTFKVNWLQQELIPSATGEFSSGLTIEMSTDATQLAELYNASDRSGIGSYVTLPLTQPRSQVPNLFWWLRSPRGQPVGMVVAGYRESIGYLHSLAVHPDYRRRGYAGLLVQSCKAHLYKCGVRALHAAVIASNRASTHVLEQNGFQFFSEAEAWQPNGISGAAYQISEDLR